VGTEWEREAQPVGKVRLRVRHLGYGLPRVPINARVSPQVR